MCTSGYRRLKDTRPVLFADEPFSVVTSRVLNLERIFLTFLPAAFLATVTAVVVALAAKVSVKALGLQLTRFVLFLALLTSFFHRTRTTCTHHSAV